MGLTDWGFGLGFGGVLAVVRVVVVRVVVSEDRGVGVAREVGLGAGGLEAVARDPEALLATRGSGFGGAVGVERLQRCFFAGLSAQAST